MEQEGVRLTGPGNIQVIGRRGRKDGKYGDIYKSFFKTIAYEDKLSHNKPYLSCYIAANTAASIYGLPASEFRKKLKKNKIYPVYYYKNRALYLVHDIVKLAKKEGVTFLIPVGQYDTGSCVYVGHEFRVVENLYHTKRIRRFASLLEMYTRMGLLVQDIYIGPSIIPKLEDDFLYAECKLITKYNKHNPDNRKRIVLCTRFGKREEAQKIIDKYSKQFPDILYMIDFDHLINLRKLADKQHKTC